MALSTPSQIQPDDNKTLQIEKQAAHGLIWQNFWGKLCGGGVWKNVRGCQDTQAEIL